MNRAVLKASAPTKPAREDLCCGRWLQVHPAHQSVRAQVPVPMMRPSDTPDSPRRQTTTSVKASSADVTMPDGPWTGERQPNFAGGPHRG